MKNALSLFHALLKGNYFNQLNAISLMAENISDDTTISNHIWQANDEKAACQLIKKSEAEEVTLVLYISSAFGKEQTPFLSIPVNVIAIKGAETQVQLCPRLTSNIDINTGLLSSSEFQPQLSIGTKDDFIVALQTVKPSTSDSWQDWVQYALDLFKQTCRMPLTDLIKAHAEIDDEQTQIIAKFAVIKSADTTAKLDKLYRYLKSQPAKLIEQTAFKPINDVMLNRYHGTVFDDDFFPESLCRHPSYLLAMMDETGPVNHGDLRDRELFALDNTQRQVNLALSKMQTGDVLAVNGPPGSGKTAMLKAVIGHQWVKAAYEQHPCPITIAVGDTNQSVTNIISAFPNVLYQGDSDDLILCQRWLPGCYSYGSFFPSSSKQKEMSDEEKETIVLAEIAKNNQPTVFNWLGKDAVISDVTKQTLLEEYYVQQGNRWLKTTQSSIKTIVTKLHQQLCEKVTALNATPAKVLEQIKDKQAFEQYIQSLSHQRPQAQAIAKQILQLKAMKTVEHFAVLKEVCRETIRDKYHDDDTLIKANIAHLVVQGLIILIDRLLDVTIRADLFHLAARYWEGQYIIANEQKILITRTPENVEEGLRRLCMVTPCLVSTVLSAPQLFSHVGVPGHQGYPHIIGRADLLILDETGQAQARQAAPLLALAKRAIAVGDIDQLQPVVTDIQGVQEQVCYLLNGYSHQQYAYCVKQRLTTIQGSMLDLMRHASRFSYQGKGLSLRGHYRCQQQIVQLCNEMVYDNRLFYLPMLAKVRAPIPPMCWVESDYHNHRQGSSRYSPEEAENIALWIVEKWPAFYQHYNKSYNSQSAKSNDETGEPAKRLADVLAIVTPYKAQTAVLKSALKTAVANMPATSEFQITDKDIELVTIGTVNALQGAEKPIVIFSAVHGSEAKGKIFFDEQPYLINVAVSRAKDSFVAFVCPQKYGVLQQYTAAQRSNLTNDPVKYLGYYLGKVGYKLFPRKLVIIEAPGKLKSLSQYLGSDYQVMATAGKITQLGLEQHFVSEQDGFLPHYQLAKDKADILDNIVRQAQSMDEVIIATDDDNVGETIAWHLAKHLIALDTSIAGKLTRVLLKSITPDGVKDAFGHPVFINENRAAAEITREIIDILIGRELSKLSIKPTKHVKSLDLEPLLTQALKHQFIKRSPPSSQKTGSGRVKAGILDLLYAHLECQLASVSHNEQTKYDVIITVNGKKLRATLDDRKGEITGRLNRKLQTTSEVYQGDSRAWMVSKITREEDEIPAPSASTLTVLKYAWALHRIAPQQTTKALQKLYEGGFDL